MIQLIDTEAVGIHNEQTTETAEVVQSLLINPLTTTNDGKEFVESTSL
jgi:hypothetical protein